MTNAEKVLAEIQRPAKKDRLPFILAIAAIIALVLSILAGWLGIVKPSAATLDNGGFCIQAKGYGDEFTGKAGAKDCGYVATPPTEEEVAEISRNFYVNGVSTTGAHPTFGPSVPGQITINTVNRTMELGDLPAGFTIDWYLVKSSDTTNRVKSLGSSDGAFTFSTVSPGLPLGSYWVSYDIKYNGVKTYSDYYSKVIDVTKHQSGHPEVFFKVRN